MRFAFLLLLLLGPGPAAYAQPGRAPAHLAAVPAPAPAVRPPTAPDTAAALHYYFDRRRHNGHVALAVGASVLIVSGVVVATASESKSLGPFVAGILGGIISLPVFIRGLVLTATHSEKREQRLVAAWQQHHLPSRWARRALRFYPAAPLPPN